MSGQELAAVEASPPAPLALLGRDPDEVLERATQLADSLARVVRDRGLALRFGEAERDFLTLHAWQVLGAFVGVVAIVERTSPLDDGSGWEARAIVQTGDGRTVAAGEAMCTRSERNWRSATDNSLRAMAQTRALRRALQGALGFIPGLAGMDVADPTAPATRRQVVALWTLAGELGWDRDETHRRADVDSLNELTREAAGELLEAWGELLGERRGEPGGHELGAEHEHTWELIPGRQLERCACGAARAIRPASPPAPASREQLWARAVEAFGSSLGVLRAVLERFGDRHPEGLSAATVTAEELQELLRQYAEELLAHDAEAGGDERGAS
ncbi:MAG: hypothetical protein ACE14W_07120 [Candidatus Velamenicoccus archaeovorus]